MNEINFNNIEELYQRVVPALNSKIKELRLNGIKSIKPEYLFEYLAENKWIKKENLTLYDMVEDILYTENNEIENFFINKYMEGKDITLNEENDL